MARLASTTESGPGIFCYHLSLRPIICLILLFLYCLYVVDIPTVLCSFKNLMQKSAYFVPLPIELQLKIVNNTLFIF